MWSPKWSAHIVSSEKILGFLSPFVYPPLSLGIPWWLSGKGSAFSVGDMGLIPGLGRSPVGGHGNPLHYSCLEHPTDRGAWQATVHKVAKSWTPLKRLIMYAWMHPLLSLDFN